MPAAVLETPGASASVDTERLRDIVLVRIASAVRGVSRIDLANDLAGFVAHRLSVGRWRTLLDGAIESLISAGLASQRAGRIEASEAGIERASQFPGLKATAPPVERSARRAPCCQGARPAARASQAHQGTGRSGQPARGHRARAYGLKIKGVPTASRLRSALAALALQRAFGNQIKTAWPARPASASAGRLLAGQLARQPRDFGTDARLIAALAAEHVGATKTDAAALRPGVLRVFVEGDDAKSAPPKPGRSRHCQAATGGAATCPGVGERHHRTSRPDGLRAGVRRQAARHAQGWPGNRRAYISHVWRHVREQRPDWSVSEIEFKCMLAEAHRAGHVVLANADLKDSTNIKDVQESAVVFKNAVFHFIRVDA
jgi:hypothetical protein